MLDYYVLFCWFCLGVTGLMWFGLTCVGFTCVWVLLVEYVRIIDFVGMALFVYVNLV